MSDIERGFSFKEARRLAKELKERDKEIEKLIGIHDSYEAESVLLAKDAEREQIISELKETSVDELSKYKMGIRVSAYKDAGYKSIWSLKDKSSKELERIDGIGQKSAGFTVFAVKDIVANTAKNIRLKVDPDKPTAATDKLIKALYQAQKARKLSDDAEALYKATHGKIKDDLKATKPARSWLMWQFLSDEKKQFVLESLIGLKEFAEDAYKPKTDEFRVRESDIKKAELEKYWKEFKMNSAGYYATLERAKRRLNNSNGRQLTNIQYTAVRNGLPEELAVAISKVELNLKGLSASLYSYQEYGVQYILNQGAVLLGDDMGLGKTIQAIASMVSLRNDGGTHFLVVCPASVIINWCREIERFSDLNYYKLHGNKAEAEAACWVKEGGVAITTYDTLAKIAIPGDFRYDMLVADEAHYVKNPKAERTKQLLFFRQHTDRVLFMTGTPLENRVSEMCFLIGCLQPDVAKLVSGSTSISMAPDFRRKISTVYFRRTKEDVLDELPEKVEKEEWIELTPSEKNKYVEFLQDDNMMKLRQVSWLMENPDDSSKMKRLFELIDEYMLMGRKIIVFSFFTHTIATIMEHYSGTIYGPITGSVAALRRQEIIDQFSKSDGGEVLVSQIQAGGTGLNIQAASVVIFCEPQFKPSIEEQAIARSYRLGQNNTVMVHRLLNVNTVDERLTAILKEKKELFDAFADKSESGEESLSSLGIKKLLQAEKEKYGIKNEYEDLTSKAGSEAMSDELDKMFELSYGQLVGYLLKKYDAAKYDYFLNESCKSKNPKVTRTEEGLFCHHIDEDKEILLGMEDRAQSLPFAYQKADRLVYCNYFEHILLHAKIAEENNERSIMRVGIGGIFLICESINDLYTLGPSIETWRKNVEKPIIYEYGNYIKLLKYCVPTVIKEGHRVDLLAKGYRSGINEKILKDLEKIVC